MQAQSRCPQEASSLRTFLLTAAQAAPHLSWPRMGSLVLGAREAKVRKAPKALSKIPCIERRARQGHTRKTVGIPKR